MIRLMLVDDHEIVRTGLRAMFELESDMEVAGEAGDGEGAVAAAERLKPDVVVMDIRMGGGIDGIDACRRLKSQRPETAVLMLTSFGTDEAVFAALMAGASGFLLKNTGRADLLRAVRLVAEGQSLLDPAVTGRVTKKLVELAQHSGPNELADLSAREREVLVLVAKGMTNREIAAELVISDATARNHVSHILEKLGLSRRTEAATLAARLGLLDQ
ncbi:MAG TPA: response regulator transcription factor [Tepidiformaceae bacterium]|nr:response regulator transcription factor [Tepidiformaceae bacterium]